MTRKGFDYVALDNRGRPLPLTTAEVQVAMRQLVEDGDLVAAVLRTPAGDLAVQVFGPPSEELADCLETVASAYRTALQGH